MAGSIDPEGLRSITVGLLIGVISVSGSILPAWSQQPGSRIEYEITPIPGWVDRNELPLVPNDIPIVDGFRLGLHDRQVHIDGDEHETYLRTVREIATPGGRASMTRPQLLFDPKYQRVALHAFEIRRDGVSRSMLTPDRIHVVDVEQKAGENHYRQGQAVVLQADDLRVGDVVELAYTIIGANPVLEGRFGEFETLGDPGMIHRKLFRVVLSGGSRVSIRNHGVGIQPTVTRDGSTTAYSWELHKAALRPDSVPTGLPASIEVCQLADWREIAQWGIRTMAVSEELPPELGDLVDSWKLDEDLDPEDRIVSALRLVQDEVEYLFITVGENSHRPRSPAAVWSSRYGDCKDKSALLVALLRRLGFEAYPAFVSAKWRRSVTHMLPSVLPFDHMVVVLRRGGRDYWFDPTTSFQGGGVDAIAFPRFTWALPLSPGTEDLEEIRPWNEARNVFEIEEVFAVAVDSQKVKLEMEIKAEGINADEARRNLGLYGDETYVAAYLDHYRTRYPGNARILRHRFEDDRDANHFGAKLSIEIDGFARASEHNGTIVFFFPATFVTQVLPSSEVGKNGFFDVDFNNLVCQSIRIRMRPQIELEGEGLESHLDGPGIRFDMGMVRDADDLLLKYELETKRGWLIGSDLATFKNNLAVVKEYSDFRINLPRDQWEVLLRPQLSARLPSGLVVSLLALVGVAGGMVWWVLRRTRVRPASNGSLGEMPALVPINGLLTVIMTLIIFFIAAWVVVFVEILDEYSGVWPMFGTGHERFSHPLYHLRAYVNSMGAVVVISGLVLSAFLLLRRSRFFREICTTVFAFNAVITIVNVIIEMGLSGAERGTDGPTLVPVVISVGVAGTVAAYLFGSRRARETFTL